MGADGVRGKEQRGTSVMGGGVAPRVCIIRELSTEKQER